jgi:nucleoside-diphosphate-sugar epimerase
MRVFVTGAAGFIGTETTKELIAGGHQVTGLARSDANVATLEQLGAKVLRGSLQDHDSLKRGARDADAVIHLAFIHDFTKFAENGAIDKAAIEAMGDELEGTNKPFIVTSGMGPVAAGVVVTEEMRRESNPHTPRVSEQAGLAYASRGVRAMAIRLPQVHGAPGKAGLISYLVALARKAPPPMLARVPSAGPRRTGRMSRGCTGWRWSRAQRMASITPSARRACRCAR